MTIPETPAASDARPRPGRRQALALAGGSVLGTLALSGMTDNAAAAPMTANGPGDLYDVTQAPYNATGDGSTPDDAAIQAAIDAAAAAGGGTVFLPAHGTYALSARLAVASNVTLASGRQRAKIVLTSGFTGAEALRLNNVDNVTLLNLDIDCADQSMNFAIYLLGGCSNVLFDGVRVSRIQNVTPGEAVRISGGSDIQILRSQFTSVYKGIAVHGDVERLLIERCDFSHISHVGVQVQGLHPQGGAQTRTQHTTIQHCRFSSMIRIGNGVGYPIYYTCAGQTVHRHARVLYNEVIGNGKPFVRADSSSGGGNADLIALYDVEDGLVHGNLATLGGDAGVSLDRSRRIIITENTTTDCNTVGINVYQSDDVTVVGNQVLNNYRDFEGELNPQDRGGIRVTARSGQYSSYVTIAGNRCSDTQVTKTQDYGIYVDPRGRYVDVGTNTLDGNLKGMVKSASSDHVSLSFTLARSGPPSTGYWEKGTVVRNQNYTAGDPLYWVCTAPGVPGTWQAVVV